MQPDGRWDRGSAVAVNAAVAVESSRPKWQMRGIDAVFGCTRAWDGMPRDGVQKEVRE